MSFDAKQFMRAGFSARTEAVKVESLKDFFADGAEPVWVVRNLTGAELARMMEAGKSTRDIEAIIQAIASHSGQVDEIRNALGIGDDVPTELIKRLEQLVMGSVEPEIDKAVAVKLAEMYPIEFYHLTNTITKLTGLGADLKK